MKKIVLAAAFLLVAFTGNSSLKGSILVNTVSFADLPDKPINQAGKTVTPKKVKYIASACPTQVYAFSKSATCAPMERCSEPVNK